MNYSLKVFLTSFIAAAVVGSVLRYSTKSSNASGGVRRLQRTFQNFSQTSVGGANIFVSSNSLTPSTASGSGFGGSQTFQTNSFTPPGSNQTQTSTIGGETTSGGEVAGLAIYGDLEASSVNQGYINGFADSLFVPAFAGSATSTSSGGSKGSKGKGKSGGGGGTITIPPRPAGIINTVGGNAGAQALGLVQGVGLFASGISGGLSLNNVAGLAGNAGLGASGGTGANATQQSFIEAYLGGVLSQNLGTGFGSFFSNTNSTSP